MYTRVAIQIKGITGSVLLMSAHCDMNMHEQCLGFTLPSVPLICMAAIVQLNFEFDLVPSTDG